MTILQSLKSLNAYPIPSMSVADICDGCGLRADMNASVEVRSSSEYIKAKALVYLWLAEAPNVTQGGISYTISDTERQRFRLKADHLLNEAGINDEGEGFGYIGSDL